MTLKVGGVVTKWTPIGPKIDKYGIFCQKNRFLPDANQKSESAVGVGGGGISVPLDRHSETSQRRVVVNSGETSATVALSIGGVAPCIARPGPKGEEHMFRGGGGGGLSEFCQPAGWIPDVDQESRQKSKTGQNWVL